MNTADQKFAQVVEFYERLLTDKNMKCHIRERFGVAPNKLLTNPRLSLKAKGLYAYIQSKPDDWDFSAERIALETSDGRDAIRSALIELVNEKYLHRQHYSQKGTWVTDYILYSEPTTTIDKTVNAMTENTASQNTTPQNPSLNKERFTKKYKTPIVPKGDVINEEKKDMKNLQPLAYFQKNPVCLWEHNPKKTYEVQCSFELLWSSYPRKVGKAKAEKCFLKMKISDIEKIKSVLPQQIAEWQRRIKKDPSALSFIPHFSTWINQKRFDDEIEKENSAKNWIEKVGEMRNEDRRRSEKKQEQDFDASRLYRAKLTEWIRSEKGSLLCRDIEPKNMPHMWEAKARLHIETLATQGLSVAVEAVKEAKEYAMSNKNTK